MTTTLTQASQQWISRPADERFTSLIDMQALKSRIRDNSATQVISCVSAWKIDPGMGVIGVQF